MSRSGLNLLVFRAGHRRLPGRQLKDQLLQQLESVGPASSGDELLAALLRAGELEASVTDADSARAQTFAQLTDRLADALLSRQLPSDFFMRIQAVAGAPVPELLDLSVPEGFAYYALHPLAYADVLEKLPPLSQQVVVIGIRTIGTTLSAVTAAAVGQRGHQVVRTTVRPAGHPYNRSTEFLPQQSLAVKDAVARGADFLIVDEGPGLSGSSFLSVAEALEKMAAAREKMTLICSHQPNPEALCSADAAQRWRRFRSVAAGGEFRRPDGAELFIGGGEWRKLLFHGAGWPASWTTMERLKYLSFDRGRLFKFAGLGHYGTAVFERERAVAEAGFGPEPRLESDGFISYPWIKGRAAAAGDLSPAVIERLAQYCAFRAEAFPAADASLALLQEMAEHNLAQLGTDLSVDLKLERPVIADGHIHPHEWMFSENGSLFKTDSGSHGDDHFFPGPTDIAWDLAGAIVEWRMGPGHAAEFLERYRKATGDDPRARIDDYIRAYSVFRWGCCKMAANAIQGTPEQERLEAAAENYARGVCASTAPALSVSIAG